MFCRNCRRAGYIFVHYFLFQLFQNEYFVDFFKGDISHLVLIVLKFSFPKCFFFGEKCVTFSNSKIIVSIIMILILTQIAVIIIFFSSRAPAAPLTCTLCSCWRCASPRSPHRSSSRSSPRGRHGRSSGCTAGWWGGCGSPRGGWCSRRRRWSALKRQTQPVGTTDRWLDGGGSANVERGDYKRTSVCSPEDCKGGDCTARPWIHDWIQRVK